jgi:predicted HTH transcriptional regulator
MIIGNDVDKKLEGVQKGLKKAFDSIKEEFDSHLDTINQNTSEIQAVYDYLEQLESKIDKLGERIDELQMAVNPELSFEHFEADLTHREQEVFLVLYAAENKISAKEMAKRLGFSEELVHNYIYNLISKGIPVFKHYDKEMYYYLDKRFKDLQARKNVLKIDDSVSKELLREERI